MSLSSTTNTWLILQDLVFEIVCRRLMCTSTIFSDSIMSTTYYSNEEQTALFPRRFQGWHDFPLNLVEIPCRPLGGLRGKGWLYSAAVEAGSVPVLFWIEPSSRQNWCIYLLLDTFARRLLIHAHWFFTRPSTLSVWSLLKRTMVPCIPCLICNFKIGDLPCLKFFCMANERNHRPFLAQPS